MPYSSTGMSVSVTGRGKGPDWHAVLYYWFIPNRNTKDGIIINIGWVGGSCVLRRKGFELSLIHI